MLILLIASNPTASVYPNWIMSCNVSYAFVNLLELQYASS